LAAVQHEITRLLIAWRNGDNTAINRLMPLVYRELHKLAKRYMGQQNEGNTLQTTAIIHEAYLKLASGSAQQCENREHFFAIAAKAMRQVLVDHARLIQAQKRGGTVSTVQLGRDLAVVTLQPANELITLDEALDALGRLHPRQSEAVELRYFGGLSLEESAKILKVSADTVMRDVRFAKAWLRRELERP
jgi:RNA polymerase sigma-70 factor, ECF subfamily